MDIGYALVTVTGLRATATVTYWALMVFAWTATCFAWTDLHAFCPNAFGQPVDSFSRKPRFSAQVEICSKYQ